MVEKQHHFLIISLAAQSHLNPTLQLAKCLARTGAQVTFATTVYGFSRIKQPPVIGGLSFASFSDGYDNEEAQKKRNFDRFYHELAHIGPPNVSELIRNLSQEGRPVTFLIYAILLPWVAQLGRELDIPTAFFSIQCAAAFAIYRKFFNGHDGVHYKDQKIGPSVSIELPELPLFSSRDLPSLLFPSDPFFAFAVPALEEHVKQLEKESKPCVLVNSFRELEESCFRAAESTSINIIPIGPLVPCAGSDSGDRSVGLDIFASPEKDLYLEWLDSKPEKSVVYASFGSMVKLKGEEKIEIVEGLNESGRSYLLVIRRSDEDAEESAEDGNHGMMCENGMIVPWCSQMEVLCHKSIGCFVTHCGWNSTLESIVAGVPIVGCPHISEQNTNAKLIEEVWGNGVRANANEEGLVEKMELKRCVDVVMGGEERGEEIRRNAAKWRGLAREAVKETGSSQQNLKLFLQNLGS
uniref:Glycosyltransferase n=1 Tax=Rubia yunnanensis TaxID=1650721 RepID=A0A896ARR8_9GENT|nr:glycosyltransferase [Rubia yunnanensis]